MSDPDRHLHVVGDEQEDRHMTPEELATVLASFHDKVNTAHARLRDRLTSRKAADQ